MIANTFGLEIIEGVKNIALYDPLQDRFYRRLVGDPWLKDTETFQEFLFGWGVLGGSGSLGINYNTDGIGKFTIASPHNQYLSLYLIGGVLLFLSFIVLSITLQLDLLKKYLIHNDNLSKIFFYTNLVFLINLIVYDGALFHPITSFVFWLSIYYTIFYKRLAK